MKYSVIIPVVNIDLSKRLLDSIAENTVLPYKILIINNSMGETAFPAYNGLPIEVFDSGRCMGVNESLNLGVSRIGDCDYIAILNDDIILKEHFFEKNIKVFERYSDAGAVCPSTVTELNDFQLLPPKEQIIYMERREGWAMSFRETVLKKIPPIPKQLVTFCGDDWLWRYTFLQDYYWYKDLSNVIYHQCGTAIKSLDKRKYLRSEKDAFEVIKKESKERWRQGKF